MPNNKIFVIQSFGTESEAVFSLITSAAAQSKVSVFRADSIAGTSFTESLHKAIQSSTLLVADVTNANLNVMYALGIAQALKKPVIFIASSSRDIPFNLAGFRVHIYDISNPTEFINHLARTIREALTNPQEYTYQEYSKSEKRNSVFISYSHLDRDYLDRLIVHLKPLEKKGLIDLWVDTRLYAGDRWKEEIEKALDRATVAILLVSADFLASDFIIENELPPILRNAEEKGTRIIPLIVKPCRFARDNSLKHFQAINDPNEALICLDTGQRETYYDALAYEVERVLQRG